MCGLIVVKIVVNVPKNCQEQETGRYWQEEVADNKPTKKRWMAMAFCVQKIHQFHTDENLKRKQYWEIARKKMKMNN